VPEKPGTKQFNTCYVVIVGRFIRAPTTESTCPLPLTRGGSMSDKETEQIGFSDSLRERIEEVKQRACAALQKSEELLAESVRLRAKSDNLRQPPRS
jgi:hypothetical protein